MVLEADASDPTATGAALAASSQLVSAVARKDLTGPYAALVATEAFGLRLRIGAHLIVNGAKHELLMEQDRYRSQFLAAFDAFVPGTPLFA